MENHIKYTCEFVGEALWKYRIENAEGSAGNFYAFGRDFYGAKITQMTQVDVVETVNLAKSRGGLFHVEKYKSMPTYDASGNFKENRKFSVNGNHGFTSYILNYEVKTLNVNTPTADLFDQLSKGVDQAVINGIGKNDQFIGALVTDQAAWQKVEGNRCLGDRNKQSDSYTTTTR
ncbi:hypothetical protein GC194_10960 [bacterium]|nr:hypothetical protein [bacterium]